jgi:outer membrane protein TolC
MKASGKQGRRWGRRVGWKAAGVTVLGLLGGSTGCSLLHDEPLPGIATAQQPAALAPMVRFPSGTANATAPNAAAQGAGSIGPLFTPTTSQASASAGGPPRSVRGSSPASEPVPVPASPAAEGPAVGGAEEQQAEPARAENYQTQQQLAPPTGGLDTPAIPPPSQVQPIRLVDVLTVAGVENPQILLAEQAVQSSLALQLQARALLLPNINIGGDYDDHTGNTQTSFGAIKDLSLRQSAYLGLGSGAIVAGTVAYPGVWLNAPLANAFFQPVVAGRVVAQRSFEAVATRNDILLDVAVGYLQLLGAEGRLAVVRQTERDFDEAARLTRAYAEVRQGLEADAERARTAALLVESDERRAQEQVAAAAAELSRLLNLDPSIRLQIANDPIVVVQLIDPHKTLPELVQVARANRPELKAAAAEIAAARARVCQEKTRPFLPTLSVGYSEGGFGGGPLFIPGTFTPGPTSFNNLHPRSDVDVFAWWTLQNLGLGNLALVRRRKAEVGQAEGRRGVWVNRIDREVADAFNLSQARFREVQVAQRQLETAVQGYQRDLKGVRGFTALPIELLQSSELLYQARQELLRTIIAFDESQFRLFVALGQPPTLAVADDPGGMH